MNRFAELLDRLVLTPARNGKLTLLVDYFRAVEDPDRGYALAAITGDLSIAAVKPAMLRTLIAERMDPVLFGYSYDYVGDLAETVSLVWPDPPPHSKPNHEPTLGDVVGSLQSASRSDGPTVLARLLDSASIEARFAIIKLVTGGLRIGVSARLAKQALADFGNVEVSEIEELWHGLKPPYAELFAWLEGKAPKPEKAAKAPFRPVMLSNPIEDRDLEKLDPADYAAEWKWDGIRVQAVSEGGIRRLYSRTGDDVSGAFPDLVDAMNFSAALDGELLVGDPREATGTFSDLQQRLNRKTVSPKIRDRFPSFMRCYDILQLGEEDLRPLPFTERRKHLESFIATLDPSRFDISPLAPFSSWEALNDMRCNPPHPVIEGVMLKKLDSAYLVGTPEGPLVQVEARPAYGRRGTDVRAARPWQALQLLFGLHVRRLVGTVRRGRAGAGRKGLFRLHRRGTQADRQICARQHDRAFRAGAFGPGRSRLRAGAGGRLRRAEPLDKAQVGRRHAFPAHLAPALGQADCRSRPHRDAAGTAGLMRAGQLNPNRPLTPPPTP